MNKYAGQDRGNLSDYEEYFAGMDASMQQKIALTTAHFPLRGRIADMGSGSGSGTFDLAKLYKNLELVGVDINPTAIEYSKKHYEADNLKFKVGDIAEKVFKENSLDGILNSSVLHHVTSFNNFDNSQISKTLRNQVAQLKPGGVLIIRDFVIPDRAERKIFLDLPNDDGKDSGELSEISTAALFEIFARDFRSSLNVDAPVKFQKRERARENFSRFEVTLKTAAEFVLRKDYRDHWSPELLEEYCYYEQQDFEENFKKENLRVVVSQPLWNPWIVENRFRHKFYLSDLNGDLLEFPPTNYLIVGEKIGADKGVQISETETKNEQASFLKLKTYRHRTTNQIFELAERPNQTIDLLPWFETANGQIFILAKKDFPRPVVNAQSAQKNLNRANYSGYLTEPISAIIDRRDAEKPRDLESGNDSGISEDKNSVSRRLCGEILFERANIAENEILEIGEPQFYFTSPGGIDERVESFLVKIAASERMPHEIENYTKFKSAGFVRALDALQILRAATIGGMFDARLEINVYRLLRELNRSVGAWIGADINPSAQDFSGEIETNLTIENHRAFEEIKSAENNFLKLCKSEFVETDSKNEIISRADFEYVVPKDFSKNTVAAIPFIKTAAEILIGVEFRDLPAPQRFTGSSNLPCVPAWRLPFEIKHKFDLEYFADEKFPKDFKVAVKKSWELGGSYLTSAGITPEIVYPLAVELDAQLSNATDLKFFPLQILLENAGKIQDAHFLILLNRLAHALKF